MDHGRWKHHLDAHEAVNGIIRYSVNATLVLQLCVVEMAQERYACNQTVEQALDDGKGYQMGS